MCLKETCSKVRIGNYLSDMSSETRSCFIAIANFALKHAIRMVQRNQNGPHQFLVYPDDAYLLEGNINTIERNKDATLEAGKETGNTESNMYCICSRLVTRVQDRIIT
jgi:hypothetical protein